MIVDSALSIHLPLICATGFVCLKVAQPLSKYLGMFVMFELGILSPMGQSVSINLVMVVLVMLGKAVMVLLGVGQVFKKEKTLRW